MRAVALGALLLLGACMPPETDTVPGYEGVPYDTRSSDGEEYVPPAETVTVVTKALR